MAIGHVKVNQYTLYLCWWLAAPCSCSWSSSDLDWYSRLTCIHGEREREGKGGLSVWQGLSDVSKNAEFGDAVRHCSFEMLLRCHTWITHL